MWTHLKPYLKEELTTPSISRHARVALYRALNLRRLIAMTGSGVTRAFGMPDWKDLSVLFARETNRQIENCLEDKRSGIRAVARGTELQNEIGGLVGQINRMCGSKCTAKIDTDRRKLRSLDDTTIIMDLCEEILKVLPDDADTGQSRLFLARKAFAQKFRLGEVEQVLVQLKMLFDVEPAAKRKVSLDGWTGRTRPLLETALIQILQGREPQKLADELGTYFEHRKERGYEPAAFESDRFGPEIDRDRDVIAHVLDTARISRTLTLNYDVQLERSMLRRLDVAGFPEALEFEDLCKDYETPAAHKKVFRIESGMKRGVQSITLGQENIGDIASFAAYSRRYQYQALHLHGRFDDPANLVATQADYLSVYMNESPAREVFREVQEILFGGNDVLLLGIGMREEDVLRPFRRFVARDGRGPHDSRQIFLLRETKRCAKCRLDQKCSDCETGNDADTLRHRINYNVLTVVFGGPKFRYAKHRMETASKALKEIERTWDADEEIATKNIGEALSPLKEEGMKTALAVAEDRDADDASRLLSHDEYEVIEKGMVAAKLATRPKKVIAARALLEEYAGRMTSRALCLEIKSLVEEKEVWWDSWRLPPYERRALYRMVPSEDQAEKRDKKSRLWIRHCPGQRVRVTDPGEWGPIESMRAAFRETRQTDNRRILRVCGARGAGKGSLSRLLMNRSVREYVFGIGDTHDLYEHTGSFIAHLAFSVEFSSVARALTRFVARQAIELQMRRDPNESAIAKGLCKTEEDLRAKHKRIDLDSYAGDNPLLKRAQLLTELTSGAQEDLADIISRFKTGADLSDDDFRKLTREVYIARREDEPRLLNYPELGHSKDRDKEDERPHRLDVLRETLQHYTDVASPENRLFVCLSGMDRICDRDGDAYNPMHRALFRLLTGAPDLKDKDPNPPIDLLLVAGRPDTPICFLSEELPTGAELPTEDEKHYSRKSKTGRILKRWPEIGRFSWEERVKLQAQSGTHTQERLNEFQDWAIAADSAALGHRVSERFSTRQIHRALWDSLAMTQLVLTCWCETKKDNRETFRDFAQKLDQAVARDGDAGVVRAVLARFRADSRLNSDGDHVPGQWELDTLILRHLSLFALPVEPWVLIGCPMVSERLLANGDAGHDR